MPSSLTGVAMVEIPAVDAVICKTSSVPRPARLPVKSACNVGPPESVTSSVPYCGDPGKGPAVYGPPLMFYGRVIAAE